MLLRKLLNIALIVLMMPVSRAGAAGPEREISMVNYTMKEGLPSNETYSLVQDASGYIWFGTDRGVVRYDYGEFKVYGLKEGLGNLLCVHVQIDREGTLWVNCYGAGLFTYDPNTDRFAAVQYNDMLNHKRVQNFYFDLQNNIKISDVNSFYSQVNDSLVLEQFDGFDLEKGANVWIDEFGARFTKYLEWHDLPAGIEQFSDTTLIVTDAVVDFLTTIDQNEFYYTDHNLLYHYSVKDKQVTPMNLRTKYVWNQWIDGELWMCSGRGLRLMDSTHLRTKELYFEDYIITGVIRDYEGVYWVSTHDNGVFKFALTSGHFIPLKVGESITTVELINDEVYAIKGDKLLRYEKQDLKLELDLQSFYYDLIHNDSVIVLNNSFQYNVRTRKQSPLADRKLFLSGLTNEHLDEVLIDRHFAMMISDGNGIQAKENSEKYQMLRSVVVGDVIYGASDTRLFRVDFKIEGDGFLTGTLQVIEDDVRVNQMQRAGNDIWIVTNQNGLYRYSITHDELISYYDEVNFPFRKINNLYMKGDRLLLSTDEGLVVCHNHSDGLSVITTLNAMNGLRGDVVLDAVELNDSLYVVNEMGLNVIPASIMETTFTAPKLIIHSSISLQNGVEFGEGIRLANSDNSVRLEFRAMTNRSPLRSFTYRVHLLLGSDTLVSYLTNDPFAQFINLSAGDYRFVVTARNASNTWSDPVALNFQIRRHFTQKWWFIVLMGLLLTAAIWGYIARRSAIKIKELRVSRELQRQAFKAQQASLQLSNAKLQKFKAQVNPHFIYNALNSIQHLFFEDRKDEANNYISTFSRLLRRGLKYSDMDVIPVDEEVSFLRDYLELESLRFPGRFTYDIQCSHELLDDGYDIPPHLIQPLVENAIKHAFVDEEEGRIIIALNLNDNGDAIHVRIEDNGIGLDSSGSNDVHESKGIELVKEHLNMYNSLKEFEYELKISDKRTMGSNGTLIEFEVGVGTQG